MSQNSIPERSKERVTLSLPSDVLSSGQDIAQRDCRSFSNLIEVLIRREVVRVERRGEPAAAPARELAEVQS